MASDRQVRWQTRRITGHLLSVGAYVTLPKAGTGAALISSANHWQSAFPAGGHAAGRVSSAVGDESDAPVTKRRRSGLSAKLQRQEAAAAAAVLLDSMRMTQLTWPVIPDPADSR